MLPIFFLYEPDHLYAFATDGQKIEWMRTNPKVCVEVDEITNHSEWASVVLFGRYRELPDVSRYAEERDHARELLTKRSTTWWQTAFASRGFKYSGDVIPLFYCIDIGSMTGYRAAAADACETQNATNLAASGMIPVAELTYYPVGNT